MTAPLPSPSPAQVLERLAFDLRSSWNHRADALWRQIDPALWRETANPWLIVRTVSAAKLAPLWQRAEVRDLALALDEERERERVAPAWFQRMHADAPLTCVAFFSLEFAFSEALPIYSGGLGNVAGDYLKAASDLGVPVVGVGLLYQQGYFRQTLDASGAQREAYPFNDTSQLPIAPVRSDGADGEWLRVRIPLAGRTLWLRAWQARAGRVAVYLLDSNDPSNTPTDRTIAAQLYGGSDETRLVQEMALGIGGHRLLRALGLRPEVCHLNEGHAALVGIERARELMAETGASFEAALAATRRGNLFTTHTAVAAAFDRFAPALVRRCLGPYLRDELRVPVDELLALGRLRRDDASEPLGMGWLAARVAGAINAVSRRHAAVSRRIFQPLFPRFPEVEVPVAHVTNGVHVPSWDSAEADALWTRSCGAARWLGDGARLACVADASDAERWSMRGAARAHLVEFVRDHLVRALTAAGLDEDTLAIAARVLDPDALTVGMARRFTDYKRPTLLLTDAARLAALLGDTRRPVQLVIAGKAHPADPGGRRAVQAWLEFVRRPDVRPRAVFLADYDLRLAERLVQGVDLWINTPRPPWEACGTSGMKVLVNGGLQLSSLDGWWAEAFTPEVGWAIPPDAERDDASAATAVYELLEREVVPAFYTRDRDGLPRAWLARMRASMTRLTPTYSAERALREYTERYYLPAARAVAGAGASDVARFSDLAARERAVAAPWPGLRFGEITVEEVGDAARFVVPLYLGDLDADALTVELWADDAGAGRPAVVPLRREQPLVGARGFRYVGEVVPSRDAWRFTARVRPTLGGDALPVELPLIAWSR